MNSRAASGPAPACSPRSSAATPWACSSRATTASARICSSTACPWAGISPPRASPARNRRSSPRPKRTARSSSSSPRTPRSPRTSASGWPPRRARPRAHRGPRLRRIGRHFHRLFHRQPAWQQRRGRPPGAYRAHPVARVHGPPLQSHGRSHARGHRQRPVRGDGHGRHPRRRIYALPLDEVRGIMRRYESL